MLNVIGVLVSFLLVILLIRKKFTFGVVLLLGAWVLGLFALVDGALTVEGFVHAFLAGSVYDAGGEGWYADTVLLALLMTLIYMLARVMQRTGAIDRLVASMRTYFVHGGMLGAIPAVYGLMPVPGGAMFSAPMVDIEGNRFGLSKDQKNFLNVWFRHIWFSIYPISSAMILICSVKFSDIDIWTLVVVNVPAFLAAVVFGLGYLQFSIRKHPRPASRPQHEPKGLLLLLPALLPIGVYVVLSIWSVAQVPAFLIGVCLSLLLLMALLKMPASKYLPVVKSAVTWKLAAAIIGIMIFREMFEASGATRMIAGAIGGLPISPLAVIISIPILLGVLTGYNLGAMTLAYPLVEPFFSLTEVGIVGITSIVFLSSVIGYLVSPIHLCNVVSSEMMKTDTTRMYKMYLPAVGTMLGAQVVFILLAGI